MTSIRNPRGKTINQLANEYVSVSSHDPFTTLRLAGQHAATMPELISAIGQYERLEEESANYITRSEEHLGTDKEGRFVDPGEEILITLHGGGILTNDTVKKKRLGFRDWPSDGEISYDSKVFDNLLEGNLPNGRNIEMYSLKDARQNRIPNIFGEYAIWTDFKNAMKQVGNSNKYPKIDLVEEIRGYDFVDEEKYDQSPLLLARSGKKDNWGLLDITGRCDDNLSTNYYANHSYNNPLGNFLFLNWWKHSASDGHLSIYPSVMGTYNTAILRKSDLSGAALSGSIEKKK